MAALKLPADAEWADAALEAVVCTKGGHQIIWQCWIAHIHDTCSWADFLPHETLRLEAALSANERTVDLTLNDDAWSLDLLGMQQTNVRSGTMRPIRRVVVLKSGVLKD
jgi:hypothetical protein